MNLPHKTDQHLDGESGGWALGLAPWKSFMEKGLALLDLQFLPKLGRWQKGTF